MDRTDDDRATGAGIRRNYDGAGGWLVNVGRLKVVTRRYTTGASVFIRWELRP